VTADPTHVDRFIEQLGYLAEGEGLPRTAGRMMGVLITSGAPLGIDELAKRLKVSRASVSTNSRLLQSLAIAQLVVEPGSRRDYLQISGDPSSSLLTLGLRRMQSMRQAIREMRLTLRGARLDLTGMRLKRMEEFYDTAIAHAQLVLRKWRKHEKDGVGLVGVNASAAAARSRRRKRDRGSRL
jgi:DNA-binding transcriptional regulator GbsR (MarR family)